MKKDDDTTDKVVKAAEAAETTNHLLTLSSGVVLRGKAAPPLAMIKVMAAFPRPKPPVYFNKTMGRDIENPDDPEFLARLGAHKTESTNAVLNALILLGTELVSVPKKFPKPEDDAWLDEYKELDLPTRSDSASWRYLTWVMFKAVLDKNDLFLIRDEVGRLSGISEADVQSAERFPGRDQEAG